MSQIIKILGLCGSLRSQSLSHALLTTAQALAPSGVDFSIFDRHGQLPLFNPDIQKDFPAAVSALWSAVIDADAIVISSPEYAHGITGNLENTLDWLVGQTPFTHKPVAIFNPSGQSCHADEAL
jgi:chromate reductase, NAD(P)H dehydrogenase (quinone)